MRSALTKSKKNVIMKKVTTQKERESVGSVTASDKRRRMKAEPIVLSFFAFRGMRLSDANGKEVKDA